MKSIRLLLLAMVVWLVAGCAATGTQYAAMESSIPSIKPGEGRIFFYRSSSMLGMAIQPDIQLNGVVVGKSKPNGFFFVDRPAGHYQVTATTEVQRNLSIMLEDGEIKYVRTSISMGVMVGRVEIELPYPEMARSELPGLAYIGSMPVTVAAGPSALPEGTSATPNIRPRTDAPSKSVLSRTTLDDLKALLPTN